MCCFVDDEDFPCQTQKTWKRQGPLSFDRKKTLENIVPNDGPTYAWSKKSREHCCQPCINKINIEREKKICAFFECGLCQNGAATTARKNNTAPEYSSVPNNVTEWFYNWRKEFSKDSKICDSCRGRLTYPCFFGWEPFCPGIKHKAKRSVHRNLGNIYVPQVNGKKVEWENVIPVGRDPNDMFPYGIPAGAPCCDNCFRFQCWTLGDITKGDDAKGDDAKESE